MNNNEIGQKKKKSGLTKYIISFVFLIVLVAITFFVIFRKYEFNDLIAVIRGVDPKYFLLALLMILIYIFFESCATKTILYTLDDKSSFFHNLEYSCIDYYFCAITPSASGGQPMVLYYMSKDKTSIAHGSQTLLINTALFKIVLVLLSIIAMIVCRSIITTNILLLILLIVGFVINLAIITLCFLASFKTEWIDRTGKKLIIMLSHIGIIKRTLYWIRKFDSKMEEYANGATLLKQHKFTFFLSFLFNLIQRIALFSTAYFIYLAFVELYPALAGYNYFYLCSIQVIIAMSVDSLPLPGGMGISEYLYSATFDTIYLTVSEELVASAMLLTRAVSFYIPLLLTAFVVILKQVRIIVKDRKRFKANK